MQAGNKGNLQIKKMILGNASLTEKQVLERTIATWIAGLRTFERIPFQYLVPIEKMLPDESIRFFHVDRNWIESIVDGALSITKSSSRDVHEDNNETNTSDSFYKRILQLADDAELNKRVAHGSKVEPTESVAGPLTGFLLRSAAVAYWPGLEVKAYSVTASENNIPSAKDQIRTIRQTRLSNSIMLCIFNGVPESVLISEPAEAIRFGVDLELENSLPISPKTVHKTTVRTFDGTEVGVADVDVFTRDPQRLPESKRRSVLNLHNLYRNQAIDYSWNGPSNADSSKVAINLLQPPFVQIFSNSGTNKPLN